MIYNTRNCMGYGGMVLWNTLVKLILKLDIATSIATLPGVNAVAIGNSTFDSNTGRFIFHRRVSGNQTKLYSVNVLDGSVLSSPTLFQSGDRFSALEFNVNNNTLYGLVQDVDSSDFSPSFLRLFYSFKISRN